MIFGGQISIGGRMTGTPSRRRSLLVAMAALTAVSAVVLVVTPRVAGAAVTWSAMNSPMPANAVAGQGATLPSVSCPADGWCVAVGDYLASSASTYYDAALIESESGSSWSAMEALLPVGASATDPQASLNSVQCAAVGSCVAVGQYVDSSGATQALVETLGGGIWTRTIFAVNCERVHAIRFTAAATTPVTHA